MKRGLAQKIQFKLLQWFRTNKRSLPWRKAKDPYKIWISEIMLQQTQVDTVIPYYKRWMKSLPNLRALARAPLSRVLRSWEGLGYYSRARNLHRTAKTVLRKWRGRFPDSVKELQTLPGIGRYTAGAIASIAFNRPEPILDGNVKRVLARIFALREAVDTPKGEKKLWKISEDCLKSLRGAPQGRRSNDYGDFNQSLMELGATVCLPENPKCVACPVETLCEAHRLKKELDFPIKARRQKMEKLKTLAAVIWKNGRVLLEKQPLQGRWGGLWVFPQWIHSNGTPETKFLKEKMRENLRMSVGNLSPKTEIEHGFTKYRVRLKVYEGKIPPHPHPAPRGGGRGKGEGARICWISPKKLSHLPLPKPHRKIAVLIQSHA